MWRGREKCKEEGEKLKGEGEEGEGAKRSPWQKCILLKVFLDQLVVVVYPGKNQEPFVLLLQKQDFLHMSALFAAITKRG